jgi:CRP/FNR family transcriptional regulator, cyclic AMP receptor protein
MEIQFATGQHIFQQGDPANRFYLILEGRVELELDSEDDGILSVRSLGPGDNLGWSWMFPAGSFQVNAKAAEPTKTIFFYGTRLRQLCEEDHDFGYEIMKRVAEAVVRRVLIANRNPAKSVSAESRPMETRLQMS